ncbi:MAG: glycosyltransferase family 10 [Bacillota bacterium]|nr:glycosyltransferase family 10 [Bacillota bacterium]
MINTNRYNSHPLELYGERLKAIRWFEENHPDDFRLYGRGWAYEEYPSYRGEVAFKKDVLKKAKFSICYENARDIPGYITEKIFDCFIYGCVPIYLGAPNVTEHIPAATFIDKRNFKSYPELSKYLRDMPPQEYIGYLEAIKSFLESEKSYPFSVEYFIDLMANKILNVD